MGRTHYSYDYPQVPSAHPHAQYRAESSPTRSQTDSQYPWVVSPMQEWNTQAAQMSGRMSTVPPLPVLPEHLHHDSQERQQQQQRLGQEPSKQQEEPISKPDPVKKIPNHPIYHGTIAPDTNPLSPTSSTDQKTKVYPPISSSSAGPAHNDSYNFGNHNFVPQPVTGGTWTNSLCSCSEPTICMTGLFCPCILYGRVQHRLHLHLENQDPTNILGHRSVNGSCVAWTLLCGVNGLLSGIQKTRVRRAFRMASESGNVFSDCLEGCCCCCCVLAQSEKEIKHRGEEARRGSSKEGYVPPSGMSFTAPHR